MLQSSALVPCFIALVSFTQWQDVRAANVVQSLEVMGAQKAFESFKSQYKKNYAGAEEAKRSANFHARYATVTTHNKQPHVTYKMAVNRFADMDSSEMRAKLFGVKIPAHAEAQRSAPRHPIVSFVGPPHIPGGLKANVSVLTKPLRRPKRDTTPPAEFDWTSYATVTPIKNQGQCGSCWAFSVTGVLEGGMAGWQSLSEQSLIDCCTSPPYSTYGCEGGWPKDGMDCAIKKLYGLPTEAKYPYKTADGTCYKQWSVAPVYNVVGIDSAFAARDEDAIKSILYNNGPISVVVSANDNFAAYSSGVFEDSTCPTDTGSGNHAILLVGYGTDPQYGAYWKVKNSWDTWWGDKGYIRMRRGTNQCGIANWALHSTTSPWEPKAVYWN